MKEDIVGKLTELALNNTASMLLGAALTLWYVYVKLRIDDHARDAYSVLKDIQLMMRSFYDKRGGK